MFAKSLSGPSTPKASVASLPPRLLRLLQPGAKVAGWGSHPLKDRAFARRTRYLIVGTSFYYGSAGRGRRSSHLGTNEHGWAQENRAKFTQARAARGSLLGQLFKEPSQMRDLSRVARIAKGLCAKVRQLAQSQQRRQEGSK